MREIATRRCFERQPWVVNIRIIYLCTVFGMVRRMDRVGDAVEMSVMLSDVRVRLNEGQSRCLQPSLAD